jgi:Plasmid recombination enzyme.
LKPPKERHMTMTVSSRILPVSGRKAAGQRQHDLRDERHIPDYVDRDRIGQNSVLIPTPEPSAIRKDIAAHRKAAGQQKLRADATTVASGILTFGTEAQKVIDALPTDDQDRLFTELAQSISDLTGHDLIGLVVHRDESAIHAHYALRGYRLTADGKEMPIRLKKTDLSAVQDTIGTVCAKYGIRRGTPKAERVARGESKKRLAIGQSDSYTKISLQSLKNYIKRSQTQSKSWTNTECS